MKRIHEENLNTPAHFDEVWAMEGVHYFDRVRMEAFADSVKDGDKVLDVGAGMFGWGEYLLHRGHPQAEVHAIDFSPLAIQTVTAREPALQYIEGSVLAMPYAHSSFDVVGAGELIEHMESPAALLAEMARVLKPGGLLIIGTVDPHCEDGKHLEYPEHLWEFTPAELVELLSMHGAATYRRVGNYDYVYCIKANS